MLKVNNIKIKELKVKPYFYSATAFKSNSSGVGSTEYRTSNKSEQIKHHDCKSSGNFTEKNYEIDDELPF